MQLESCVVYSNQSGVSEEALREFSMMFDCVVSCRVSTATRAA